MEPFKFPHEAEEKPADEQVEFEVEVVDDTPEDDRGRAPMKEPPSEVTDEELAQYSDGVKKRIQHFSKGYHEERRAKEAALREREEALKIAQRLADENKKLQGSISSGQQALLDQAKRVVANELDEAKRKFKTAYEAGDADAIVAAQEDLAAAKIKAERVNNFKPAPLQQEKPVVQPDSATAAAPAPQVDPKARAWQDANPWFGKDEEMTSVALVVHKKLVEGGVDTTSDDYYERINARMRQVFPDAFTSQRKKTSVVTPATRSTAPKKIVLTQSAVNIAKRLGLSPEQYAREVAKLERAQNG